MNNTARRFAAITAFLMAAVMLLSAATAPVAAQSLSSNGGADNIAVGDSSQTIDLAGQNNIASADDSLTADGTAVVELNLNNLANENVDLSSALVNLETGDVTVNAKNGGAATVSAQNVRVDTTNNIIEVVLNLQDNGGTADDFEITSLTLSGVDASNANSATGVSYVTNIYDAQTDTSGTADDTGFSTGSDLKFLEVNDPSGGETYYADLGTALSNLGSGEILTVGQDEDFANTDLSTGSLGADTDILNFGSMDVSGSTIQAQSGTSVTFTQNSGDNLMVDLSQTNTNEDGLTFDGITFDSESSVDVVDVDGSDGVTFTNTTFTNLDGNYALTAGSDNQIGDLTINGSSSISQSGTGNADLIDIKDTSGTVTINNLTATRNSGNTQAIILADSSNGEINVSDSTLTSDSTSDSDSGIALDVQSDNTLVVENNKFTDSQTHINDGTAGGAKDLDAIYADNGNTFDPVAIREDSNGNIQGNAIYGHIGQVSIDNQDHTTIVAGTHQSVTTDFSITSSGVTITSPNSVNTENATILNGDGDALFTTGGSGNADSLTITDLTLDRNNNNNAILSTGNEQLTNVKVANNVFPVANDHATPLVDLTDGSTTVLISANVSANTFKTTGAQQNHQPVAIDEINDDGSTSETVISNNIVENSSAGTLLSVADVASANAELTISGNEIVDHSGGTASIDVADVNDGSATVTIDSNNLDAGTQDPSATAIDLGDISSNDPSGSVDDNTVANYTSGTAVDVASANVDGLSLSGNTFDFNQLHVDSTSNRDFSAIESDNTFNTLAVASGESDLAAALSNGPNSDEIYGQISAGIGAATSGDNVFVGPGTYPETLGAITTDLTLTSTAGADQTSITDSGTGTLVDIGSATVTVEGFTFNASGAGSGQDITLSSGSADATINDSIFVGAGVNDRDAIATGATANGLAVNNLEIDSYDNGIHIDNALTGDVTISSADINNTNTGVDIQDAGGSNAITVTGGVVTNTTTGVLNNDDDSSNTITVDGTNITAVDNGVENTGVGSLVVQQADITADLQNGNAIRSNANNLRVNETRLYDSEYGIKLDNGNDPVAVQNDIINNTQAGVYVDAGGGQVGSGNNGAVINFNDIVDNNIGIEEVNTGGQGIAASGALANYYGSADGPSGAADTDGDNDKFGGSGDKISTKVTTGINFIPFLNQSVDNLPQDNVVVVTDQRSVFAKDSGYTFPNTDKARIAMVVLNDTIESNIDPANDISVIGDVSDLNSFGFDQTAAYQSDNAISPADPYFEADADATDDQPGSYTIEPLYTGSNENIQDGRSAEQVFIQSGSSITLSADSSTVAADGNSTTNLTAQVTDGNGTAVAENGVSVKFQIRSGASEAGAKLGDNSTVTTVSTKSDGSATTTLNATTSGVDVVVRAIAKNTAPSTTVTTVEPAAANFTLSGLSAPSTVTQNQSYTVSADVSNEGTAAGTQDVDYTFASVSKNTSVQLDAGNSTTVEFDLTASETNNTATGNYTHTVATSGASDLTQDAEVVAPSQATADFGVSGLSAPGTVNTSESLTVNATITNNGGAEGTQNITFRINDTTPLTDADVVDSVTKTDITLASGASQDVSFDVTAPSTNGTYTHGVFTDDANQTATLTVEEAQQQEPSVSVTFSDQTVPNGTEEITIDSANFTRADGSAGDYVVVVHTIDEFGAPVGNVSDPIGASGDLTGAEENITVNLTAADGPINSITENVTLRAMLHTTANDSAFGTRLGSASAAIDGIEPGDETDDANITVEEAAGDPPELTPDERAANFDEAGNNNGVLDPRELINAINQFRNGNLTPSQLIELITIFQDGGEIETQT